MIRRPLWLGTGFVLGVGGTLWAQLRVKRVVRRASSLLSPTLATGPAAQRRAGPRSAAAASLRREVVQTAREAGGRIARAGVRAALSAREADPGPR